MTDTQRCFAKYGNPKSKEFQNKYLKRIPLPADIAAVWPKYGTTKITAVYMHVDAVEPLFKVFRELISTGLSKELKTYDGCHNIRKKRGGTEYSIHSWGLAFDFNAALNPLGVKWGSRPGMFSKEFVAVWRKHGWECGANWKFGDAQHYQWTPKA